MVNAMGAEEILHPDWDGPGSEQDWRAVVPVEIRRGWSGYSDEARFVAFAMATHLMAEPALSHPAAPDSPLRVAITSGGGEWRGPLKVSRNRP